MQLRLITLIGIMAFLVSLTTFANPGRAQAALTLNNFVGFETNGLEEALATDDSPTISNATPHSGDFHLFMNGNSDQYDVAIITGGSTDSDNDFILGFAIRFNGVGSGTKDLVITRDDAGGEIWTLRKVDTDELQLLDATGSEVFKTTTSPFSAGVYFIIEVLWQHLASGNIIVHIDGVEVGNETGVDLTDGGAISEDSAVYRFEGSGSPNEHLFDDVYTYSGATGVGDFLGNPEIFRYQNRKASITGDTSCVSTSTTLNAGQWQDVGETPLNANLASFNDAGDGASIFTDDTQSGDNGRHGPHGDASITGTIEAAKWLHRLKRGGGGSTTHSKCYGNDADTIASATISVTNSFSNFFTISVAASEEPLSSEHFAHGMHTSGAQDIDAEEIWSFILHLPAAEVTRRIFRDQS